MWFLKSSASFILKWEIDISIMLVLKYLFFWTCFSNKCIQYAWIQIFVLLNVFFLCMASYGISCFKWIEVFVPLFLHSLVCNILWLYYIMSEFKHCSFINAFLCVWSGVVCTIVNGLKYLFFYLCIFLCVVKLWYIMLWNTFVL
jgi:hypothetical protein